MLFSECSAACDGALAAQKDAGVSRVSDESRACLQIGRKWGKNQHVSYSVIRITEATAEIIWHFNSHPFD